MIKLMIDVDGVLADFIAGFTMLGFARFGSPHYTVNEQQNWDGFAGLSKEQTGEVWKQVHDSPHFWESLPACASEAEFEALDEISIKNVAHVYFVTNRTSKSAKQQTENFLLAHGIDNPTVICTQYKGEFAEAIGVHYSLEDKPENADCIAWISKKKTQSFILDRPYNRGTSAPHSKDVVRVSSVMEFLRRAVLEPNHLFKATGILRTEPEVCGQSKMSPGISAYQDLTFTI